MRLDFSLQEPDGEIFRRPLDHVALSKDVRDRMIPDNLILGQIEGSCKRCGKRRSYTSDDIKYYEHEIPPPKRHRLAFLLNS